MIPIFTLTRQHKLIQRELNEAFERVINGSTFILGPSVGAFETAFAKYLGATYAVGVASGTDALTLALLALGIGKGDEIILPANSYPSAFGVAASGARLRLVDINPLTYTVDPAQLERAITKKTKAIVPVHMYGQPANMKAIMSIARNYKIPVIEDCAQAHGAVIRIQNSEFRIQKRRVRSTQDTSDGGRLIPIAIGRSHDSFQVEESWKKVGTIGDIGCFSFYPTKNLGALGDGGIIVTNSKELYQKVKLLRMYGEKERYQSVLVGKNSRLDELQAALLLVKLKYLDKWIERRRRIAKLYIELLSRFCTGSDPVQGPTLISLPIEPPHTRHVYHLFVIRSKQRDRLKAYLEKKGIGTAIHYPVSIHLVPSFAHLGYKKEDFPESEKACEEVLSLPMFPELTAREVTQVVQAIRNFK